ncbi:MAG: acyl-CoA synthetase, partial [Pseudomonadota bacterium]
TGGVNVMPQEVENVLSEHPLVREVAVVGLPHAHWGEIVCACVVTGKPWDVDVLDAHCRSHLAPAKRPKMFRQVDEIPKNPGGKTLKRVLRARFEAEAEIEASQAAAAKRA